MDNLELRIVIQILKIRTNNHKSRQDQGKHNVMVISRLVISISGSTKISGLWDYEPIFS
jgi:hypothetical protein